MKKRISRDWSDLVHKSVQLSIDVNQEPCGWDLDNFQYSFHEELITLSEFKNRVENSIIECNIKEYKKWMEIKTDDSKDSYHLQFIHDRFVDVYKEKKDVGFLIKLREIISTTKNQEESFESYLKFIEKKKNEK